MPRHLTGAGRTITTYATASGPRQANPLHGSLAAPFGHGADTPGRSDGAAVVSLTTHAASQDVHAVSTSPAPRRSPPAAARPRSISSENRSCYPIMLLIVAHSPTGFRKPSGAGVSPFETYLHRCHCPAPRLIRSGNRLTLSGALRNR